MAVATATALLACGPSDPLESIRYQQAQGRVAATLEPLRDLLSERRGDAEVLFLYGRTLSATGQAALAEWSLREAMKDPDWVVPAGLQLAADATRGRNFPSAIEVATQVLEVDPENIDALLIRASAYTHSRIFHEEALLDVERVLELDPENIQVMEPRILALIGLERTDEIASAIEELGRKIDESALSGQVSGWHCATSAIFAWESEDRELAETRWANCLEAHPADPEVVLKALPFYDSFARYDRSIEVLRIAVELDPDARVFRGALAARLRVSGLIDEAEQVLLDGTQRERLPVISAAWLDLAKHYQTVEDYSAAATAVGKAVEVVELIASPEPSLLFEYADALLIAGEYERSLGVADQMTYKPHQEMIRARVAQEKRDYAGALEHFESAFVLWPDNPFARYYAALAAEALGDFDLAIEQYRYSIRISPGATDARIRVARIHMAQDHPGEAIQLLRIRAHDQPLEPEGELLSLELWALTGRGQEVDKQLELIRADAPDYIGRAMASVARGLRARANPAAAVRALLRAGDLEPENLQYADALRILTQYSIEGNQGREEVEADLVAALAANPDAPEIREIAALRAELLGEPRQAVRKAYNAVLEVESQHARALEGLGRLAAASGDHEEALSFFDRAAAAEPGAARPRVEASRALLALGRGEEARTRLDAVIDEHAFDADAARLLAELQLERQVVSDRTLDLAKRAVRFGGGAEALQLLARVEKARGESEAGAAGGGQEARRLGEADSR